MLAPSLLDVVQHMLLIIKFVGGKFRDLEVNHENNENWHPTKITRYLFGACLCREGHLNLPSSGLLICRKDTKLFPVLEKFSREMSPDSWCEHINTDCHKHTHTHIN